MKRNLIFIIVILLVITGCGKKADKVKITDVTKQEVIEDKVIDGIDFTNTALTIENGISRFITKVTNNTDSDYYLKEYTVIFKDKDNNIIATVPGYVDNIIKVGESKYLDSSIDRDLSNTTKVEYEVVK